MINAYPLDLTNLTGFNTIGAIKTLGDLIVYTREFEDSYTLRFAGEDGILNTSDDKIQKGFKGKPVE